MNCMQMIMVGETKETAFLKDSGDVWSWISHDDCNMAMREYWSEPHWEPIDPLHVQISGGLPIDDFKDDYPFVYQRLKETFKEDE